MEDLLPDDLKPLAGRGYDIEFVSHAQAILTSDFPDLLKELGEVLLSLTIPVEEIIGSGGGETKGTQRLRRGLDGRGWKKHTFVIEKAIDGVRRESTSHEVDHFRTAVTPDGMSRSVALEIEWNNKDPFFDRDLQNFHRLHAEGAISVGIIVTRGASLQREVASLIMNWADQQNVDDFDRLAELGVIPTARQRREVLKRVDRANSPMRFREAWTSHFVADKYGMATTHWSKLKDRIDRGVGNPCPLLLLGIPSSVVTFGEDVNVVEALLEEGADATEGS